MTMSLVTAADSGAPLPLAGVLCPDAGEEIKAEHIRGPVADFLAECDDIRNGTGGLNDKVDRAGGGNNIGAYGLGTGTGPGVQGLGGTTGPGGNFTAGTNADGVTSAGNGTGSGISCTGGATGPGIIATPGTAQSVTVPRMAGQFAGYVRLTGANLNDGVDPGANNALHGQIIPKATLLIDDTYAILESYNIASITNIAGSVYEVTFIRQMANANYGIKINVHGAPGYAAAHNGTKTQALFRFVVYKTDTLALGFGAGATEAYFEITGKQ